MRRAFKKLTAAQKKQFLCLRSKGTKDCSRLGAIFDENNFTRMKDDMMTQTRMSLVPGEPQETGVYVLSSRFNHSCVPNARNMPGSEANNRFLAGRDIAAGEELTFCYTTEFLGLTSLERREKMRFAFDCMACVPGSVQ